MQPQKPLSSLYFLGLFCLVSGVGLLGFCLYIVPFAFFGVQYEVPHFFIHWLVYLDENHGVSNLWRHMVILLPIILFAIFLIMIARVITRDVEISDHANLDTSRVTSSAELLERESYRKQAAGIQPPKYKIHPLIFFLLAILGVFIVLGILEFLIIEYPYL